MNNDDWDKFHTEIGAFIITAIIVVSLLLAAWKYSQ